MKIENSFEVPAPPERAWALLMDVPRIIPCMPGATLDETVDDGNWKATMAVNLGPISLSFKTDVKREEADEAARRATLSARARDARGRGNANATIESSLTPLNGGTKVDIVTDLQLTGAVAQYGRGLVPDVSSQLVTQFAECLKRQLGTEEEAGVAVAEASRPVAGVRLGLRAFLSRLGRLFGRKGRS
ncbi:MAG TPA: SRPBCC family protein [Gaiellaceae bacterium]